MLANMRINGRNEEGILILELDLGRDPGERRDQNKPEEEENVSISTESEDGQLVDKWDCRFCIVPENFEDLISPCGCQG